MTGSNDTFLAFCCRHPRGDSSVGLPAPQGVGDMHSMFYWNRPPEEAWVSAKTMLLAAPYLYFPGHIS